MTDDISVNTTYALLVHEADIPNVAKLNDEIKRIHENANVGEFKTPQFRDMAWQLPFLNPAPIFAANMIDFTIDELSVIVEEIDWNSKLDVILLHRKEDAEAWKMYLWRDMRG